MIGKTKYKKLSENFSEEIVDTLGSIGRARSKKSQNYQDGVKLINAKIANLEANLHIEIDMERIEDRSKALSFIGIEIAEALKEIPIPEEKQEKMYKKYKKLQLNKNNILTKQELM